MAGRRTFLKGIASSLLVPSFESLGAPVKALAQEGAKTATRLAFVYIPNGVNVANWYRDSQETLAPSLQPLQAFQDDFSLLRNLQHAKANANGDGPGDHARANAAYLTGCQPKKTAGSDIKVGTSVDQMIASAVGHQTLLPSLELSTNAPRRSGRCDSDYSCAYQYNLSWYDDNTPAPAENNPRLVFERLFGSGNREADHRRRAQRRSVLDFVKEDAKSLHRSLGREDQGKLEEYFTSLRHVEARLEAAEKFTVVKPEREIPLGIPASYQEHIQLQFEMMLLAFKADITRVSSFMLGAEGSNRSFPEIGVQGKHHNLSHHRGDPQSLAALAKIDRFYAQQFALFLGKLKATPDGESGNLLDSSMIVYGGGIKDGNQHNHIDLPVLLAGRGNGALRPGQMHWAAKQTPMTNLYRSLAEKMGTPLERIGDSTGLLKGI